MCFNSKTFYDESYWSRNYLNREGMVLTASMKSAAANHQFPTSVSVSILSSCWAPTSSHPLTPSHQTPTYQRHHDLPWVLHLNPRVVFSVFALRQAHCQGWSQTRVSSSVPWMLGLQVCAPYHAWLLWVCYCVDFLIHFISSLPRSHCFFSDAVLSSQDAPLPASLARAV